MTDYRILALDGGGVRGVFQARLLQLAEERGKLRVAEHVDMIAGTSTGALVGLGLAARIPAASLGDLFSTKAPEIFRKHPSRFLRRGGRFNSTRLREVLEQRFRSMRLTESSVRLVIPVSVVDTYTTEILTEKDDCSMVDAALATSAAPTYFRPASLGDRRSVYADGGLWANDPSFIAVDRAVRDLQVEPTRIRILSIGTGEVGQGQRGRVARGQRMVSASTISSLYDFLFSLQAHRHQELCRTILEPQQILRINTLLPERIRLDDAKTALDVLPSRAEEAYRMHREWLTEFFSARPEIDLADPGSSVSVSDSDEEE